MDRKTYLEDIPNANSKDFARKALIHYDNYLSLQKQTEEWHIKKLLAFGTQPDLYLELGHIKQHLVNNGLHPRTVRNYFNAIKTYLRAQGIRIYNEDVKTFVRFPKILREEKHALDKRQIQALIDHSSNYMRFVILALVSSGMRVSELLQLEYRDLKYPYVKLRAETTKTGVARTTFFSSQVWEIIQILKSQAHTNDYVFCSNYEPFRSLAELETKFSKVRHKAGLESTYNNSNVHHVTIHRFRAFCKTQASDVINKDFAEGLIGHEGYLGTYNTMADQDKRERYLKLESRFIFNIKP